MGKSNTGKAVPLALEHRDVQLLPCSQICSGSLFLIAHVYFSVKAQVQMIEICSLKLKDAKIQGDRFISLI